MVRFRLNKKGVAVVCLWALIPGAVAAPFIFWQSIGAGLVFAALWLGLCLGWLPARCESFEGSVTLGEVRVSSGLLFKNQPPLPHPLGQRYRPLLHAPFAPVRLLRAGALHQRRAGGAARRFRRRRRRAAFLSARRLIWRTFASKAISISYIS